MHPGENRRAGRSANRVAAKRVLQQRSLVGEPVDIRRRGNFGKMAAISGNCCGGVIVRKDEENVRTFGGSGKCRHQCAESEDEDA